MKMLSAMMAVVVLVLAAAPVRGAAPPPLYRDLDAAEQKELDALLARASQAVLDGAFEKAVRLNEQAAVYRERRQGVGHWQARNARLEAERNRWLLDVRPADRAEIVRALKMRRQASQQLYSKAEKVLRQALAVYEKLLGEQHVAVAVLCQDIAACLRGPSRDEEALALYRRALAIRRKALGEDHADTAETYVNTALFLVRRGKSAEALDLFRRALAIRRKVLGEKHPDTAISYSDVGYCLKLTGKVEEAAVHYRQSLAIRLKVLGEGHPTTTETYDSLVECLLDPTQRGSYLAWKQKLLQIKRELLGEKHPAVAALYDDVAGALGLANLNSKGKWLAEARLLHEKALAIRLEALGEEHPLVADSYDQVANCVEMENGDEALRLLRRALAIRRKVLGEYHVSTANSYMRVANTLVLHMKMLEAFPLYERALLIRRKLLGEHNVYTLISYGYVRRGLTSQGRNAEALALARRSLALHELVYGKEHSSTAQSCREVASCLEILGKYAEALGLHRRALAIDQKVYGQKVSGGFNLRIPPNYGPLAHCLDLQGNFAEALLLYRKQLAIEEKALAAGAIANTAGNMADLLIRQGKYAEALPLLQKALAMYQIQFGEQDPLTAPSYSSLANCLAWQGKYAEAVRHGEPALVGLEINRLQANSSGFDRARLDAAFDTDGDPRADLAACLVRLGKPVEAWQHAESGLARGLLDDLAPEGKPDAAEAGRLARLRQLDEAVVPLLVATDLLAEQKEQLKTLTKEREDLLVELARSAARRARERVFPLERIQKQIPPDAAVVFWIDAVGQHLGCVLRRTGPPAWVLLPGSGPKGEWKPEDDRRAEQAYVSLAGSTMEREAPRNRRNPLPRSLVEEALDPLKREGILNALARQRLEPLLPHLKGVRRLLVAATGTMAAVPVEAITDRFVVSYVSSATLFARGAERHRPLEAPSLLVLADPAFNRPPLKQPDPPAQGLLVQAVLPGGPAARLRIQPGDVLLRYDGKELRTPNDLKAEGDDLADVEWWRDGKKLSGRMPPGKLGLVVDPRPVATALAEWRKQAGPLLAVSRGGEWPALPGTRLEARALAGLVPRATLLLGSDASEQRLRAVAASGKLGSFRILHLATHGQVNLNHPTETALLLARDRLPADPTSDDVEAVLQGKKPLDGRLTVGALLSDEWPKLDADLVVLSACQTGLGQKSGGDGMLGFSQALLRKGARTVLLSRWKVDDAATALLMDRFYRNLLGKRDGLEGPMKRAEALAESKTWLRTLPRKQAEEQLVALVGGLPRGERGSLKAGLPVRPAGAEKGADDRPFAAPYYWAAFVLLGDPD